MPSSACDWSSDVCSSDRSEEHTSELQSRSDLVCRLLLEKKKQKEQTDAILQYNTTLISPYSSYATAINTTAVARKRVADQYQYTECLALLVSSFADRSST